MHPYLKAEKILWELRFDFAFFSMDAFVECVSKHKGREIVAVAWEQEMPSGWFGAWVTERDEQLEYILYYGNLSLIQRIYTQLHELAHLCYTSLEQLTGDLSVEQNFVDFVKTMRLT